VRDSLTGLPAAWGALGIAQNAQIVDTMRVWDPTDSLNATDLRTENAGVGVFSVTIMKPGYAIWRRGGVEVTGDKCGPTTVRLVARLEPIAASQLSSGQPCVLNRAFTPPRGSASNCRSAA
jgi:hypothetical protein